MKTKTSKKRVPKKATFNDWAGNGKENRVPKSRTPVRVPKIAPPKLVPFGPPDRWVIISYEVTPMEIKMSFVKQRRIARHGGYEFIGDLGLASTWHSFTAARKYLRSKPLLKHCDVLNVSRLERLQADRRDLLQAEDERRARLGLMY